MVTVEGLTVRAAGCALDPQVPAAAPVKFTTSCVVVEPSETVTDCGLVSGAVELARVTLKKVDDPPIFRALVEGDST